MVADPVIASELLRDKNLDKSTYAYRILDAVSSNLYKIHLLHRTNIFHICMTLCFCADL